MDANLRRYLQRVADRMADKTGDKAWSTVDLDQLYLCGVSVDRSVDANVHDLLARLLDPHHIGQRYTRAASRATRAARTVDYAREKRLAEKEKSGQLQREIDEFLGERKH